MRIFKILLAIILIMGVVYFVLDRQLFYYGKSDFNFYGLLPLKINPEYRYDFEGGFVIWDEHGMSLVGKGVKYWNSDIEVDKIIGYGFTDEKLIVQVADTAGNKYYIEFSSNKNPQSKQDIIVNVWGEAEKPTLKDCKWIKIKGNEKVEMIELFRFGSLVILILSALLVIFKTIKLIINRAKKSFV